MSGIVGVLKKPGGGEIRIHSLRFFSCADMHFKSEPNKVVVNEGDPFFNFSPGFKNKCAVVLIEHEK